MSTTNSLQALAADRWPVLATTLVILASAVLLPRLLFSFRISRFPVTGLTLGSDQKRIQAYASGAKGLYVEGYRKFKDSVFRIATTRPSPVIVLAPKFLPELRKLPDSVVSIDAAIDEAMETKYTEVFLIPIATYSTKAQLTPALPRLNIVLSQEVEGALSRQLPSTHNWTEVNIHHVLLRVIAMASGRIFVGPELCRSEKYIDAAINYTVDVMSTHSAVHELRPWLRPILAPRLPQVQALQRRVHEATEFMKPIVERRKRIAADPNAEKPDDMLQWMINDMHKFPDKHSQNLARVQLSLSFAAIHTTTVTATNVFYDLVAMPELVPQLRQEVQEALAANGGQFTSNALQSMKKLDSVIREAVRIHPLSTSAFQRKVLKPFTLSNGQTIPAGTCIEVSAAGVCSDTDLYPDADRFDPLRFYRLRQEAKDGGPVEKAALNQFVSVTSENLTFGFGRHACPGRFFAANEIKIVLANALLRYDFKAVDGTTGRYPNIEYAHISVPDPTKMLLCKLRDV